MPRPSRAPAIFLLLATTAALLACSEGSESGSGTATERDRPAEVVPRPGSAAEAESVARDLAAQMAEGLEAAFAGGLAFQPGGSPAEIAAERSAFEAIEALTEERHEAAYRIDLQAGGRSALELLGEIVAQSGIELDATAGGEALHRPVALQLERVSRIEAIERVCAAAGLRPVYREPQRFAWELGEAFARGLAGVADDELAPIPERSAPSTQVVLAFEPGLRTAPVAFAGPFAVEVERLAEHAPHGTGELTLAVRAIGLAPEVLGFLGGMHELITLDALVDARGASLSAEDGVRFFGSPEAHGGYLVQRITLDLRNLLRSVRAIERVEGALHLDLPVEVERATWERGRTEPLRCGAGTLAAVEWGPSARFELREPAGSLERLVARLSARGDDGQPLGTLASDSTALGGRLSAGIQAVAEPAAVDLKLCTTRPLAYDFTLASIPLLRHAEMPERSEPLVFEGTAPATVEFVRFLDRDGERQEIELRVGNVSNKDALLVVVTLAYVDAHGAQVGSFSSTLAGEYDFEQELAGPVVERGQVATLASHAFFLPGNAASIRPTVEQVEFADGSDWRRELY